MIGFESMTRSQQVAEVTVKIFLKSVGVPAFVIAVFVSGCSGR
jgi:hypothetical protein